jgi:ubiquinol-cytochrome c reductase cytochrome b subunit
VNNQEGEEFDFDKEAKKYQEGRTKESKVVPFWPVFLSKDFFVVGVALNRLFLSCLLSLQLCDGSD